MGYCPVCGTQVDAVDRFCKKCGRDLRVTLPSLPSSYKEEVEMNSSFCPSCGKPVDFGQSFCNRCGFELRLPKGSEEDPVSPILAMNQRTLYIVDGSGVTTVRTWGVWSGLVIVLIALAAGAAVSLVLVVVPLAVALIVFMLLAPISDRLRFRRLSSLVLRPARNLPETGDGRHIPWESFGAVAIKGSSVRFLASRWHTARIAPSDAHRFSALASSRLGVRFAGSLEGRRLLGTGMKRFVALVGILFLGSQALLVGAAVSPFLPGEKELYSTLTDSQGSTIAGLDPIGELQAIFTNNFQIALIASVPGLGLAIDAVTTYNTGRVVQVIGDRQHISPEGILLILAVLPHSWLEELSYPVAGALGIFMITEWRRMSFEDFANPWKRNRVSVVMLGVSIMLACAAALEVAEPPLGVLALVLWVPVVAAASLVASQVKRLEWFFA